MDDLIFFGTVAFCVVGFPIALAIGRRIDGRSNAKRTPDVDITSQLRQLQDSVDAIAIEVERLSEVHRFAARLPVERPVMTQLEQNANS